jgi:hypothetical protein
MKGKRRGGTVFSLATTESAPVERNGVVRKESQREAVGGEEADLR